MTDPSQYSSLDDDPSASDGLPASPPLKPWYQRLASNFSNYSSRVLPFAKEQWEEACQWVGHLDKESLKEQWKPVWPISNAMEALAKLLLDGILLALWWTGLGLAGLGWWWVARTLAAGWQALQEPVLHEPARHLMPGLYKNGMADEACYQYRGALLLLLARATLLGAGILLAGQLIWVFGFKSPWDGPCIIGISTMILLVPCVALVQQLIGIESYQRRLIASARVTEVVLLLALSLLMGGISLALVAWVSVLSLVLQLLAGLALVGVVHMDSQRVDGVWQQHRQYSKGRKIAALNEWLRQGGFVVVAACWIGPGTAGVLGVAQQLALGLTSSLRQFYPWAFPQEFSGILNINIEDTKEAPVTPWKTAWFPVIRWATMVLLGAVLILLPLTWILQWVLPTQVGLAQTLWLWLVGLQLGQVGLRILRWVLLSQPEQHTSNKDLAIIEALGHWPTIATVVSFWATVGLLIPATALGNSYGLLWILAVGLGLEAALLLMAYGLQHTEA
ncbi:MAG: hypothetical protein QE263_00310 [Vampirovibrionales bacterium]|nr:hypothetical protein [Vampirovibrionales bacterium]